jgi:hypothetical protein
MEAAVAAWRERQRRGGGGDSVEEKAVTWRLRDFNMRERHLMWREMRRRGGGGSNVEEKAVAWRLRDFNVRDRKREAFVFCIFNFIYLTNLTVKLLF